MRGAGKGNRKDMIINRIDLLGETGACLNLDYTLLLLR